MAHYFVTWPQVKIFLPQNISPSLIMQFNELIGIEKLDVYPNYKKRIKT